MAILALDVDYRADGGAVAAGVLFADWSGGAATEVVTVHLARVEPYRPGAFFERELPCLLAVIEKIGPLPEAIVIDGYVWLGADAAPGLGAHLHAGLGGRVPVVGVAKTWFSRTPPETEVLRGQSGKPLYVTAAGMPTGLARDLVRGMHGRFRVPTLLALVDRACRAA